MELWVSIGLAEGVWFGINPAIKYTVPPRPVRWILVGRVLRTRRVFTTTVSTIPPYLNLESADNQASHMKEAVSAINEEKRSASLS
ncbi:hypothetical protein AGMMS49545_19060 [Betaproteobacteria bacterium]|nr:hypothetical protein AGMMS49545_19060 [Betaproteobacteria bacterium]